MTGSFGRIPGSNTLAFVKGPVVAEWRFLHYSAKNSGATLREYMEYK
jgi:hypothetical protein